MGRVGRNIKSVLYLMGLNLMLSWGWGSKILIFWGVGGIKFEFLWAGKLIFWEGGDIKFEFWWGVLIVRIGFDRIEFDVKLGVGVKN